MPLGVPELLILLVIVLVIFGGKRVPQIGRQLGGGLREFRESIRRRDDDDDAPSEPPALPAGDRPPAERD